MAHGAPDHRLVIDLVELVKLINKIETIDAITAIANITNIDSVDLIDRITRIDAIDSLGEVSLAKVVPLVVPPVLVYDDFDSGVLKWTPGGDGRVELSNVRAFSGSGSMRIYTGPLTGKSEEAGRNFAVTADLKMRTVLRFSLASSGMVEFIVTVGRYTAAERVIAAVRYDVAGKKWQYATGAVTYADIPGGAQDLNLDLDTWHYLQLECNFATKKYVSLKCDALSVDMSTIDIWSDTPGAAQYAYLHIFAAASAGNITEAWVDDVFVEAW